MDVHRRRPRPRRHVQEADRGLQTLKLLAVLAHPDDESLGFGGTLAKYAREGVETHLVTAARGERGRFFGHGKDADPAEVGPVREAELRAAADVLGIREVALLGYGDAVLDQTDPATAIRAIAAHIRRIRPHSSHAGMRATPRSRRLVHITCIRLRSGVRTA